MFENAQTKWDRKILTFLTATFNEFDASVTKSRSKVECEQFRNKWHELSTLETNLEDVRPIYSHKDFLEIIFSIFEPKDDKKLLFSNLDLKTKNLDELKESYPDISQGQLFMGIKYHNKFNSNVIQLENDRLYFGEMILKSENRSCIQNFLKKGSPRSLRGSIWSTLLGSDVQIGQFEYFNSLKNKVSCEESILDKLIFKDIQLTASNDDQYFVFEDILYQIQLCFFRDNYNYISMSKEWLHRLQASRRPELSVIPFHGFTMYVSAFCYVFDDPVLLYFTFREFYLKYLYPLSIISDDPKGIVSICVMFERLLERGDPELWQHFMNNNVHPIHFCFKWLLRVFAGYLPPEQLLLLWDLIIAHNSLDIVPLLAVAILSFRRKNLFQVRSLNHFENIVSNLSTISVYSLLQMSLINKQ